MICHRCALRLRSLRPVQAVGRQHLNTLANPRPAPGPDHQGPPAATSTSAAQPFTTPLTPAPHGKVPAARRELRSTIPAGTPLEGLNYFKNKQTPLALEDHEYPEWLWDLVDTDQAQATGTKAAEGDAYAKSKKQRRLAAKAAKKAEKANANPEFKPVPLNQQTIDLPTGDGTPEGHRLAELARTDLKWAMRKDRRASVKQRNYLGGMR